MSPPYDRVQLTDLVIAANGGLKQWSEIESIEAHFNLLGAAFTGKGISENRFPTTIASTKKQTQTQADEEWIYTPDQVWKQKPNGEVIEFRDQPRKASEGHTRETPWDDLHLLYFVGYAMWRYVNFPFLLVQDGVETDELEPHTNPEDQTWRVLEATFHESSSLAVHCQAQKYYFDDKLVLQRHDYAPDVVGGVDATHYAFDNVSLAAIQFATLRRVVICFTGVSPN
ncbi:uncharacterized protein Z518_03029 [Rhinocladiella mackenziei CBS 650.93]|uniref:Uncharacterized protein n=1 Tax=Rhinocladiella mackenziei CBS 650.93 TaxID=1442369 RepID=A0A0D2HD21_9EURO|nr:uncharacterized protein Z518_03029 [Rhinocladiella mackenziei CBS 650.93]KIX08373.1 hypothetical protein Z518_03029 [Rhinocladiella mackenziei CBS 650.93]